MMYRVSHVEQFRQCLVDDNRSFVDLIEQIKGIGAESEAMKKGTAFHKALEMIPTGVVAKAVNFDGYTFNFKKDFDLGVTSIKEIRHSKIYMVDGLPIEISGQIDALHGKRIEDHKTTKNFDPDRFLDGYQWRLYLDIFDCDHFRWNVFVMNNTKKRPNVYNVKALHTLEQYRYPALSKDCQNLVSDFARFVREHVENKQWN